MHVAHPKKNRLIAFSAFFILVCFAALLLRMLFSPIQRVGSYKEYILTPGTTSGMMLEDLRQKQMITAEQTLFLKAYMRLIGADNKIRAGKYVLRARSTPYELVRKLVRGEVEPSYFRIHEGYTFSQVLHGLAKHAEVKQTIQGLEPQKVMELISGTNKLHYEGWLFPDTYSFHYGTRDVEILKKAYQAMQKHIALVWQNQGIHNILTDPYQVLILASIIEKEAGALDDRRRVAGVFQRRLSKNMRLQADPTVIYGLGNSFNGNLKKIHLTQDSPYNSYTRAGLPPTPIALPSLASLQAAVNPSDDDALYFVSKGDGSHHFSATLSEHNLAVKKYQLKADNKVESKNEQR